MYDLQAAKNNAWANIFPNKRTEWSSTWSKSPTSHFGRPLRHDIPSESSEIYLEQPNTLVNRLGLLANWTLANRLRFLTKQLVSKRTNIWIMNKYMDHQILSLVKWRNISFMYKHEVWKCWKWWRAIWLKEFWTSKFTSRKVDV